MNYGPVHSIGKSVEVRIAGIWRRARVVDLTPNITGEHVLYHLRLEDPWLSGESDVRAVTNEESEG